MEIVITRRPGIVDHRYRRASRVRFFIWFAGWPGSSSKGTAGYGTEIVSGEGEEKDDDDDGASALPSWLKDMTRQKSDNEKEARAKSVVWA